jgi:thiamine-monophosphate kinase
MGDDTAIIRGSSRRHWLVTTDLSAEGVHFRNGETDARDIGYKATVANLSDVAAMGGRPHYLLVALAIPKLWSPEEIDRVYEGIMRACRAHGVELIGGDTSASKQGLFVSITLIGSVPPGHALRRDGARTGDLLYVTGTLGDSRAGLQLLTRRRGQTTSSASGLSSAHRQYLIGRHLRPVPRLQAGQVLAALRLATAAIDLSDGLSGDLSRLCEQSTAGAELDMHTLPCSVPLQTYSRLTRQDAATLALEGGEDYELLFSVRPGNTTRLARVAQRLGCRVTCVGRVTAKRAGLTLRRPDGRTVPVPVASYEHFRS